MKVLKQSVLLIGLSVVGVSVFAADPVTSSPADPASMSSPAALPDAAPSTPAPAAAPAYTSAPGSDVCNPTRPAVVSIGKPHPVVHKFKPKKRHALKGAICH
jgi:hypothetical protein